ncbi:MAG: dihydrodipicolinate reductase [uncultured bacterium]|nr:MAG: dihydrodipicolinate reductase [uncultured bacterium]
MTIRESHQDSKVDVDGNPIVSGTAIALRETFKRLGAVMDGEIDSVRNRGMQRQLGIQNLDAHGYHWVNLTSPNGEKREFTTQIEGREPYVDLTLESIPFLARKIKEGTRGEIYTPVDVIKERMEPIA